MAETLTEGLNDNPKTNMKVFNMKKTLKNDYFYLKLTSYYGK